MEQTDLTEVLIFVIGSYDMPDNHMYGIVEDIADLTTHSDVLYSGRYLLHEEERQLVHDAMMAGSFFSVQPYNIDDKVAEIIQRMPKKVTVNISKPEKPN